MKIKIDLLLIARGCLAVSVLIWHLVGYTDVLPTTINIPGRTAVWIFFGISGYVMSYGFISKKYLFNKKSLFSFYTARFFRIFPLFFLISIISSFFIYTKTEIFPINSHNFLQEILMIQFNHSYRLSGVFWTLGIEVQYYIVAPVLAFVIINYLGSRTIQTAFIYFFLVAIVPFSAYFFNLDLDSRNLVGNLSHFFVGMISCFYVLERKIRISNLLGFALLFCLLYFSNYLYHSRLSYYFVFGHIFIDAIICLLIILNQNFNQKIYNDKFNFLKFITWTGVISYGIYAWHPLIIDNISIKYKSFLVVLILTWIISHISYKFFEIKLITWNKYKK